MGCFFQFIFLVLSLFIQHFATEYADMSVSHYVHDILLDNLPIMRVDDVLNYGVQIFTLFIIGCIIIEPKRIPFIFKSLALFFLIRAAFIPLTHLGPSPLMAPIDQSDLLANLVMGNDFFFSGHTGTPFLLALIFWDEKFIRYVSLTASFVFGSAVLLGQLHYSIDVFAAFFITYAIFSIAVKIFPKEYKLFKE